MIDSYDAVFRLNVSSLAALLTISEGSIIRMMGSCDIHFFIDPIGTP
jgi:hypothetical protein